MNADTRSNLEAGMASLLEDLPPVRLEKPRAGRQKPGELGLTRLEALRLFSEITALRGEIGSTAALRVHLGHCYRSGHFDIVLEGYLGPYMMEANVNRRSAEAEQVS